jgi:hypothetical protein
VLNHISGSRGGIAGVYQRHDWASEKRTALDAWAEHVVAAVEGRAWADNVVTLTRAGLTDIGPQSPGRASDPPTGGFRPAAATRPAPALALSAAAADELSAR